MTKTIGYAGKQYTVILELGGEVGVYADGEPFARGVWSGVGKKFVRLERHDRAPIDLLLLAKLEEVFD